MLLFDWVSLLAFLPLVTVSKINSSALKLRSWSDVIRDRLLLEIPQPYQIVCLSYNTRLNQVNTLQNDLMLKLGEHFRMYHFNLSLKRDKLPDSIFEDPRSTGWFFIFVNIDDDNFQSQTLIKKAAFDCMTLITYRVPRPRVLMLLFGSKNATSKLIEIDKLTKFLEYTWKSAVLIDFTIFLTDDQNCETLLINYNPFFKKTNIEEIAKTSGPIFPDKLRDVNQYMFIIPIAYVPGLIEYRKREDGSVADVKCSGSYIYELFAKRHNFKLVYFPCNENVPTSKCLLQISELLDSHYLNIGLIPIIYSRSYCCPLINHGKFIPVRVFVPNTKVSQIDKNILMILVHTMIFSTLIFLIWGVMRLSENYRHWTITKIIRLALGDSADVSLVRISDKLVFATLIMFSIFYSSDFIDSFVNVQINQKLITFDTFEAVIDKSGLPIYVSDKYFLFLAQFYSKETFEELEKRAKILTILHEQDTVPSEPFIYISIDATATKVNEVIQRNGGQNFLVPTELVLANYYYSLMLERASPFLDILNHIFLQCREKYVIPYSLFNEDAKRRYFIHGEYFDHETYSSESALPYVMAMVLGIGMTLACFALLWEFRSAKVKKKEEKKIFWKRSETLGAREYNGSRALWNYRRRQREQNRKKKMLSFEKIALKNLFSYISRTNPTNVIK